MNLEYRELRLQSYFNQPGVTIREVRNSELECLNLEKTYGAIVKGCAALCA